MASDFKVLNNLSTFSDKYSDLLTTRNYYADKGIAETQSQEGSYASSLIKSSPITYAASLFAVKGLSDKLQYSNVSQFFSRDSVYNFIRKAEVYAPVFRIPLRASQLGDLVSPFASSDALRWSYSGSEMFNKGGGWRDDFKHFGELVDSKSGHFTTSTTGKSFHTPSLRAKEAIRRYGVKFEKSGALFGSIVSNTPTGKISLSENVFMMERAVHPASKGGLSGLWEASKRVAVPFQALDENSPLIRTTEAFYGNLSDEARLGLRKVGGFVKHYGSDFAAEFFRGMNRFLKEPIPFLDKVLSTPTVETLTKSSSRDPFDKAFGAFLGTDQLTKTDSIAFGRLPQALRPYVSSKAWQASSLKLVTALSAKGALYTKALPTAYFATDTLRRKFDSPGSALISTPLFAGIGIAAGSLIKSSFVTKGIFSKHPISKTQLAGGVIGGLVGLLPTFDKGITSGAGTIWSKANIAGASAWSAIGGQESLKRQEDLFPGLTNPLTGAGFVSGGAILGHIASEIGSAKSHVGRLYSRDSDFFKSLQSDFKTLKGGMRESAQARGTGRALSSAQTKKVSATQDAFIDIFDRYNSVEKVSRIESIREVESVLKGTHKGAPRSQGGLLAYGLASDIGGIPEMSRGYSHRVSSSAGRTELAGRIVDKVSEVDSLRQGQKVDLSGGRTRGLFNRLKAVVTNKTPSAARGAARGALAFTGISMIGALVAGPGGGNLSPIDLIPGWMIRLTGGGKSRKEASDVFTGKKEVAINKARWWSLGSTPFEGHKVDYFRKHRSVLMQSDAKVNALYGSRDEMEKSSAILHPIRALIDPTFLYRDDVRMSRLSPTPLTSGILSDVPIVGNLLSATVGEVFKPTQAIRSGEWQTGGGIAAPRGYGDSLSRRGIAGVSSQLGGGQFSAEHPGSPNVFLKNTFESFTEQSGLRGFLWKTGLEEVGYKSRDYTPQIERGNSLFSNKEAFWSLNLGDPFGGTEGLRRYIGKDNASYYNPLSNMAPSWLPSGKYTTDFKHGNYFRKAKEGYLRLPGAGYETLNPELKGLHPENYSVGHKYKILSDVAYQSDDWKFARSQALQKLQAGVLSSRDRELVSEANRQIDAKTTKRAFRKYQFKESRLESKSLTVSAVYADGSFSALEYGKRKLSLGGINFSEAALVRDLMENQNYSTVEKAREVAREKKISMQNEIVSKLKVGSKISAHVKASKTGQYKDFDTKVYIPSLIKSLSGQGASLTEKERTAPIRYNKVQKAFGKAWETYTHNADLPITPAMAFNKILPFQPQAKFIKRLDPIELYAQTQVYGRDIQMWQRYKSDFIDTALNDVKAKIGGDFVPKQKQFERTFLEYFDKLKWYKNYTLEVAAKKKGDDMLSRDFGNRKRQTIFGANPYDGFSDIWRALPSSEKDFYRDFLRSDSESDRGRILSLTPSYMQKVYIAQWQNRDMHAMRNRLDSGTGTDGDKVSLERLRNLKRVEGMNWSEKLQKEYEADTGGEVAYADWMRSKQLEKYFANFKLPEKNWVGFNPMVDLEDVKLQVAKQEGIGIHDIGLWGNQEASIVNKPYVIDAGKQIDDWTTARRQGTYQVELRRRMNMFGSSFNVSPRSSGGDKIIMKAEDTRVHEIKQLYNGYGTI